MVGARANGPIQASSFAFTAVEGRRIGVPNCRCVTRASKRAQWVTVRKGLSHCWAWCCLRCVQRAALGRYFLEAALARHSRLNVSSRASLALNPRFALYLMSAQLRHASWCAFCETWFSAIGRQALADRSVWCHSTARRQPACQCSLLCIPCLL